ncbi:MAG: transketolase-like TK C-terminal-containing protein [Gammaproteobacteria bacterium]
MARTRRHFTDEFKREAVRLAEQRDASARIRLAVSRLFPQGWHRYVGEHGDVLGIERFGASAPGQTMLDKYGFTVDNVCARLER